MLAERDEVIIVELTPSQIEEQRALCCRLGDQIDDLEDKLKVVKADFKAKADALGEQERHARLLVRTRRDEVEVRVQEWLTRGNAVVRIRADTGELVGDARNARADELQEKLFKDGEQPPPDDGFGAS